MFLRLLAVVLMGRLAMFFARKFPPFIKIAEKIGFPLDCDLCLGFWTYLLLSILFEINLIDGVGYMVGVSEVTSAMVLAFIVYVFGVGWKDLFSVTEVRYANR